MWWWGCVWCAALLGRKHRLCRADERGTAGSMPPLAGSLSSSQLMPCNSSQLAAASNGGNSLRLPTLGVLLTQAFVAGAGWFNTGDLGYILPAGVPGSNMAGNVVLTGGCRFAGAPPAYMAQPGRAGCCLHSRLSWKSVQGCACLAPCAGPGVQAAPKIPSCCSAGRTWSHSPLR